MKSSRKNATMASHMANVPFTTQKGKLSLPILIQTISNRDPISNRIYNMGVKESERSLKKNPDLVYYRKLKAVKALG